MIYKVLHKDGSACAGGSGAWPLPTKHDDGTWEPGAWLEVDGPLVPCHNGLHLCDGEQLVGWIGPAVFVAEYGGERVDANDKIVVRRARLLRRVETWNERTARLFACDCAEHVLPLFEEQFPGDVVMRQAIETARRFARGEATCDELAAARDAAWAAAWDAARDAAWDAAWAAARDAAWDAAGAAARAAARDAARDAARAAARDAARAAVGAAAWAAARAAAWAAAWAAERRWQTARLREYLSREVTP